MILLTSAASYWRHWHRTIVLVVAFSISLFSPLSTAAQQTENTGSIAGVIVDAETGDPLIGANVLVHATLFGTSTDLEGRLHVEGPSHRHLHHRNIDLSVTRK